MDLLEMVVHSLLNDGKNLPVEPSLGLDYLFVCLFIMVKLLYLI